MWDGVDKRKFARAEYPCMIKVCKDVDPTQAILTHTEDISIGGVRALSSKKIEMMTEVDIEIDLMDTLPNITLKGIISRLEEVSAGKTGGSMRYDIGIKFTALDDESRRRVEKIILHFLKKKK